jgi:transposase
MGVSGRKLRQALLAGVTAPVQLAALAKGRWRTKKVQLQAALHGRLRPQHPRLLTHLLTHLEFLEESIASGEAEVEELCRPLAEEIALLETAPGVSNRTAPDRLADIGVAMEHFPSARPLCSWAKLSPGTNESAGTHRSGQTGHGTKWLRSVLVECAHAASHTKHT